MEPGASHTQGAVPVGRLTSPVAALVLVPQTAALLFCSTVHPSLSHILCQVQDMWALWNPCASLKDNQELSSLFTVIVIHWLESEARRDGGFTFNAHGVSAKAQTPFIYVSQRGQGTWKCGHSSSWLWIRTYLMSVDSWKRQPEAQWQVQKAVSPEASGCISETALDL